MTEMGLDNAEHHLVASPGSPKMRHKTATRFEYDFYFGTVVMSWGRLRLKQKRNLDGHGRSGDSKQPPSGFAATVEVVPVPWLFQRAFIGGWSLIRDQRGSPSFYPRLSFPITVSIDADVMRHASSNNVPGLQTLFSSGMASVNDRTAAGWTPLHLAAAAGHTDSCRYLLGHGADVTSAGHVGVTPLHIAAAYGHLDVIKVLVDNEGDPEARNQHGFNTIFEVLHSPFIADPALKAAIIIWILQQEHFVVDVNGQDYQGNSILGWFTQHHPKGVRLLLKYGTEVNLRAHDGSTALHKAAARGYGESVRLLMDSGADPSIIENDGSTALVRAAEQGCMDVVQQLTAQPDELAPDKGGSLKGAEYRPVQLLCEQGMPGPSDVVNLIIKACSQSKATDQLRNSEIWHAAQQGYWSVVSKLQEAGVDPYRKNEYGYRALVRLVYKGDLLAVDQLIQSGSQPALVDDDLVLSLTRAAASGHADIVSHLLLLTTTEFFDHASGSKALVAAAAHGHLAIVQMLLSSVPEHCWYRALVRAAEHGHLEVVNLFLDRRIHPIRRSVGGDTAIVRAARYGHLEVVKRLLSAGADPNQLGWFGYSALVRAAYNGHEEVVDCLLEAGALPDLPEGEGGDRAMVRAVRQGHHDVVSRLRRAGAQPVDANAHEKKDGPSKALMKAAVDNDESTLIKLLQEGADPNIAEADGNTPLSRACENGHLNIVSTLLANGAHPYAFTKSTVSPLGRAAEGGHLGIVEKLSSAYHHIPVAEKRTAMRKASEKGHFHVTAFLVEHGLDPQSLTSIAGVAHFNILNHWMESIIGNLGVGPQPARKIEMVAAAYPVGPPTWGYDGSLVAKFRYPFQIFFRSDLTSSNLRCFWSSVLLKFGLAIDMTRTFAVLLGALAALLLGLGLLGIDSVVRGPNRRAIN